MKSRGADAANDAAECQTVVPCRFVSATDRRGVVLM